MWAEIRVSRVALGVSLLLWAAVLAADNPPPREDPGKKLVEEICSFCHGLARLKGQAYTRDQWSNVVKGLILDYLAKNFGPSEQGKEEK
jgi:cytochrome c5